ncbi:hypothetical protein AB4097_08905 [Microvirga sp. 2MCAF35]|uniref:hypothetical protein n=1 Tax=Microvirga sp. 2MCAF35 TaxID=3232987 RepID=UPI003F9D0928
MTTIVQVGEDVRVNTSTAYRAENPHIARFTDGSTLIAWSSDGRDGSGKGVYFQKFDAFGQLVFADDRLGNVGDTTGDQILRDVTVLSDGGWLVTYSTGTMVRQCRFNADGSVKNVTMVNVGADKFILNAKAVLLTDGGWAVVWSVNGDAFKQGDLYMQRFSADGTRLYASDRPVNVTTDGHQEEFGLAALSNGGWAVTWTSYKDGSDVYQQVYSSSGSPLQSSDILVNRTTANSQSGSQITALKGGGYVISWISFGSDGSADIYQQRYSANGGPVSSTDQRVNLTTTGNQYLEDIIALEDGGWIVTWSSSSQPGFSSSDMMPTARRCMRLICTWPRPARLPRSRD